MLRIIFIAVILGLANAAQEEAATELTITAIKRVLDTDDGTTKLQVDFESAFKDNAPGDPAKVHLQIEYTDNSGKDQQISLYAVEPPASSPIFIYDLKDLNVNTDKKVSFLLATKKANDDMIGYGTVEVSTLPVFLEETPFTGVWVGDETEVLSLRITDINGLNNFQLASKDCHPANIGNVCYFIGATTTATINEPTEFCQSSNPVICDSTFTFTDAAFVKAQVTEAELKYPESGKGTISIKPSTQKPEIVVYKKNSNVDQNSVVVWSSNDCQIGSAGAYIGSTDKYQVLIVETKPDPIVKSKIIEITDYEVVGTALSSSLIETRWTRNTVIGDTYKVSRTHDDADVADSFEETTVTCTDTTDSADFHCFAYFVGVAEEKSYDLTVNNQANNPLNKITLTGTMTPASGEVKGMELKISSLDTKWHKGLRSFEINTCVHHAETSELSSYEAILINKRGQWKKIHGVTQRMENELCFEALHLNIYDFDLNEDMTLAVLKRGNDGITVLESTETNISVGGNGLATALRNSSSGAM